MRIFFIKALFLLVTLGLLFNPLGTLADRTAPLEDWRTGHQERLDSLQRRGDQIEAITLGNSHSDSVDFSVLSIEGQSLALAAADLFEIENYTAALDEKLPRLKIAFIALSYYSFSWDNAKLIKSDPRRIRFYSMVPTWSPIEGDWANFLLGKLESYTHVMSVVRSDSWKGVWQGLFTDTTPEGGFVYDGVTTTSMWGECSHYTAEQLDPHAQHVAVRNVSTSLQMANAHPGLEQDSYAALARTIEQLQSRGVRVVLFTPAYHEKYNQYFAEDGSEVRERMKLAAEALQQTYGVEYYDFSIDPEFPSHPELFYNSDHLNECGGRVLSEKLLEKMEEKSKLDKKTSFSPDR